MLNTKLLLLSLLYFGSKNLLQFIATNFREDCRVQKMFPDYFFKRNLQLFSTSIESWMTHLLNE